jgi:hypothetical protein
MVTTTMLCYRLTYVFVSPPKQPFDDPRLKNLVIGVRMVGSDPPTPPSRRRSPRAA